MPTWLQITQLGRSYIMIGGPEMELLARQLPLWSQVVVSDYKGNLLGIIIMSRYNYDYYYRKLDNNISTVVHWRGFSWRIKVEVVQLSLTGRQEY